MFTRAQYMNKECTHREYYAQFVNKSMRDMVLRIITLTKLQQSREPFFNDVTRLQDWDCMKNATFHMLNMKQWRELNYPEYAGLNSVGWSLSDNICILKEAARQLVDEAEEAYAIGYTDGKSSTSLEY